MVKDKDEERIYSPVEAEALDLLDTILALSIDDRLYTIIPRLLGLIRQGPGVVQAMLDHLEVINSTRTPDTRTLDDLMAEVNGS